MLKLLEAQVFCFVWEATEELGDSKSRARWGCYHGGSGDVGSCFLPGCGFSSTGVLGGGAHGDQTVVEEARSAAGEPAGEGRIFPVA